jgi:hypothetical protein
VFVESKLAMCTSYDGPSESLAKLAKEDGATNLKQSCDSLGQPALTTCARRFPNGTSATMRYYLVTHSDKYMAECVENGGQWGKNKSPEAEIARAQQELDAQREKMGL